MAAAYRPTAHRAYTGRYAHTALFSHLRSQFYVNFGEGQIGTITLRPYFSFTSLHKSEGSAAFKVETGDSPKRCGGFVATQKCDGNAMYDVEEKHIFPS